MKKIVIICLIILFLTLPVQAQVKVSTLLTCKGLTQDGFPTSYSSTFSLSQDRGVQYYVAWQNDDKQHQVAVKWFDAHGQLISQLTLNNFSKQIVRDYISFSQRSKTQYFIPQRIGRYHIYLYIDNQVVAVTEFKVVN